MKNKELFTLMPALIDLAQRKFNSLSPQQQTRRLTNIEDRKERNRVEWFISQGKCPCCGTKLKRGKKGHNHIRKWWCINCNTNFSKD